MADEASETMAGAVKNYLGALGFILPLVGFEELVRHFVDAQHPSLPLWASSGLILAGLLIYALPAVWKRLKAQGAMFFPALGMGVRAFQASLSGRTSLATLQAPPQKTSHLKDVNIFAGSAAPTPLNPRFTAKFTRNGQRARLYVDARYYPGGIMGPAGWIRTPRTFLTEYKDFVNDISIDVAILTPFEYDGRKLWRWGPPTEKPDPKATFQAQAWHRGRIALLVDGDAPEYFYFIIDSAAPDVPPHVIGRERFDFAREWEAEESQK
jgi:hypothetical protein